MPATTAAHRSPSGRRPPTLTHPLHFSISSPRHGAVRGTLRPALEPRETTQDGAGAHRRGGAVGGAVGGALGLLALFALDLLGLRVDYMGYTDDRAIARILREYGGDVARGQLALLGVMVLFGAGYGLLGATIGRWRARARGVPLGRGRAFAWGAGVALAGHALLLLRHLVKYPQLYSEAFYDRGGPARAVMVALTRHTRPSLFAFVAVGALAAALPLRDLAARLARAARGRMRLLAAALTGFVAVAVVLDARSTRVGPHPALRRPNVLVVAVDSLRADRLFGAGATRFPAQRSLAEQAVRFRRAYVTVPRTFPSFVTLLTGRWPHEHGIRHMFPSAAERERIGPSLPSALAAAGYRTAVVSDYAGEIFARTPLGFDEVDVPRFDMHTIVALRGLQLHVNALPYAAGLVERLFPYVRALPERADPHRLADRALPRLRQLAAGARDGRPFFATVFFSTPHFPYASPYPYYARFVDPLYAGPFLYDKPPLAPAAVGPTDARHIQALYDGAIAAVDAELARLLRGLADAGVAEDTIVVVLADHGENLWEDARVGMGHGDHLIGDRADHVPLLVFDPRLPARARDVDAIVRDVDVAPTLAALCGVPLPFASGVDLGPLLSGERRDLGLAAFSETEYWFVPSGPGFQPDERLPYPAVTGATDLAPDGDVFMRPEIEPLVVAAKHRAIRLGDWKLTYRPTRAGVRLDLYDLATDPEERASVATRFPERFVLMRDRLYEWLRRDPAAVQRGDFVVPR